MVIRATIYVEPTPKGRPRVAVKGGRTFIYTPHKTVRAESMIRESLIDKGAFGEGIPLRLEATFYRPRPKSLPKRVTMPVSRPDWDNYAKLLTDALEKYLYPSDAQITTCLIRKRFGTPPRIELVLGDDKEPCL